MQPKHLGILLVLSAALVSATSQILLKYASYDAAFTVEGILQPELIIVFFLFGLTAILYITGLKYGELTVLYPLLSTTYVWVIVFSPFFFKTDTYSIIKLAGVGLIIAGVYYIGKGSENAD